MTKQELTKMAGNEEQAAYAMEILLKHCKEPFVKMAIMAELTEIENEIKELEEADFIWKDNGTYRVNWRKEHEPFGDEPGAFWHATEEQKAQSEENVKRLQRAEALLYKRNRTMDLIAVR